MSYIENNNEKRLYYWRVQFPKTKQHPSMARCYNCVRTGDLNNKLSSFKDSQENKLRLFSGAPKNCSNNF